MFHSIFFVCDNCMKINIFHTSENIIFNNRIFLRKFMDQFFNLSPLGTFFCATTGCTVLCKAACTLDKMQVIIISPVFDICLPDQIHRTDQLHSLKICTMELRHHSLYLRSVKHSHQDRLDHIIIVMSKSDLVAAKLLCLAEKLAPYHTGTEIAWGFFYIINRIEDLSLKHCDRNPEKPGIVLDLRTVCLIFSRIHL